MAKQDESVTAALRNLPSVDALLKAAALENCVAEVGRKVVVDSIRRAIDNARALIVSGQAPDLGESAIRDKIVAGVRQHLEVVSAPYYRKVINATGIILHTALGRAVLPVWYSWTVKSFCAPGQCPESLH